jgi:hypothetical protein
LSFVKAFFFVLLPHDYPVACKEWAVFEYLESNYGVILDSPGDRRKDVYREP